MDFNYSEVNITANRDRSREVRNQGNKADMIWNNRHSKDAKTKVYKTFITPIIIYAVETRADNSRMKSNEGNGEMRVVRRISGYTLRDRIRNSRIRDHI